MNNNPGCGCGSGPDKAGNAAFLTESDKAEVRRRIGQLRGAQAGGDSPDTLPDNPAIQSPSTMMPREAPPNASPSYLENTQIPGPEHVNPF